MKTTRFLLPTGWKGKNGLGKLAETIDNICTMLNGINCVQGGDVFVDKDKIHFRISPVGGGDATPRPFRRVSTDGADVTIGTGYVLHANNAPAAVAETVVEITGGTAGSPHYVVLEYNYDTKAASIIATGSSTLPQSEAPNIFRCALASYYLDDSGTATLVMQMQSSNIVVPGWA